MRDAHLVVYTGVRKQKGNRHKTVEEREIGNEFAI